MRNALHQTLSSAVLATVAIWTLPASAVITLNGNFDSGSVCLVATSACDDGASGGASTVSGNTVTLIGRDNFNNGEWKWIYFQVSGVNAQQLTFHIGDDFATGGSSLNNHRFVYSYDQTNWS